MPLPELPEEVVNNVIFEVKRPFGPTPATVYSNQVGSLVFAYPCGRSTGSNLQWSHILYCDASLDIRDGISRTSSGNAILYTDGDRIEIADWRGVVTYVVVMVTNVYDTGSTTEAAVGSQAVHLLYHSRTYV